jgi:hypothetical protein
VNIRDKLIVSVIPCGNTNFSYFQSRTGIFLPNTDDPSGPRYVLVRPGSYDPKEFSIADIMKVSIMMNEVMMLEDDNFLIAGSVGILDFTGVTLQHFMQFNPTFIQKVTMISQDSLPVRQKGTHFVKMPQLALTVFNVFQSFLNEKNRKRVSEMMIRVFILLFLIFYR